MNVAEIARKTYKASSIPAPKNGQYHVALLVGGPADIARELRERLARERGVLVKYHMEWKRPRAFQSPIKRDVDVVIILTDMLGHPDEALVVKTAKSAGVPFIRTQRKWATLGSALSARGIGPSNALVPPQVTEAPVVELDEPEPEPQLSIVEAPVVEPEPTTAATEPVSNDERELAAEMLAELGNDARLLAGIRLVRKLMKAAGMRQLTIAEDGTVTYRE